MSTRNQNVNNNEFDKDQITEISDAADIKFDDSIGIDLNEVFNGLPIRIVGSHEFPMFYAADIGKILGISNIRVKLRGFSSTEIVSGEIRENLGITAYRANGTKYEGIILLTEFGVYRLMFTTESELAETFREWFYDVIYKIRTTGTYALQKEITELKVRNEKELKEKDLLVESNKMLSGKLQQFKNLTDKIHLFEMKNDPRRIQLSKTMPEEDKFVFEDSDYSFSDDECVTIDNWEAFERNCPEDAKDRQYSYKVTLNPTPSDHTNYKCLRAFYVRDGAKAMKAVDMKLRSSVVGKHVYAVEKSKIIAVIDGVENEY